jgi:F-type H+-transporting ATPase subunit b
MEDIINAFGIDSQIINFAILLVALVYFLYNPILNLLREREEKIAAGIKDAEAAAKAKADADIEKKAILTEAHTEAGAVNARAKVSADTTANEILAKAQTSAAAVLADAAVKAEQLKAQAQHESEAEIAKTAILAAEKILKAQS